MTVKQIPECHTLLTGKHTLAGVYGRVSPCYVNHLLCSKTALLYQAEHSDRVGGLTASPAQNFWSNQIRYRKPGLSRNTTDSCYFPNKVHLRLLGEEIMGTSWSGRWDGKTLLMVAPGFLLTCIHPQLLKQSHWFWISWNCRNVAKMNQETAYLPWCDHKPKNLVIPHWPTLTFKTKLPARRALGLFVWNWYYS